VDTVRDLGRSEPWQESLQRSRARRGNPSPRARRSRRLLLGASTIIALALPGTVLPGALAGGGAKASAGAALSHAASLAHPVYADLGGIAPSPRFVAGGGAQSCQPASEPTDYVNPLAGARVRPERIDQGVDYAGSGTLAAIGAGTVTYMGTDATGWPGSFIEYRLLDGPDAGCYVYYAEGVNPAAGLRIGEKVAAGQPIAGIIAGWSSGIEVGWGAGTSTTTYAAKAHEWSAKSDEDSIPTAAGKSFSALIASLGGPSGKIEGGRAGAGP
jgi:murein DD-endopeptidase MepM/ murein hydrolase activator NlpD